MILTEKFDLGYRGWRAVFFLSVSFLKNEENWRGNEIKKRRDGGEIPVGGRAGGLDLLAKRKP